MLSVLLGLLLIISITSAVVTLTYGTKLRDAQKAIACTQGQTQQLRDAAAVDRQSVGDLVGAILTPEGMNPEMVQQAGQSYLAKKAEADAKRAQVAPCPPIGDLS